MELQIVNLETAILAKQVGFDWECYYAYDQDNKTIEEKPMELNFAPTYINEPKFTTEEINNATQNGYITFLAPEQDLLRKYISDLHDLYIQLRPIHKFGTVHYDYIIIDLQSLLKIVNAGDFASYEEGLEAGLTRCLNIIIDKQNKNVTST